MSTEVGVSWRVHVHCLAVENGLREMAGTIHV